MIIRSSDFSVQLVENLENCQHKFIVLSAFIKLNALEAIANKINVDNVTIVARWQKGDILNGASDLEVYELCKSQGWKFGICLRLHAKVFAFDDRDILIGSANLTNRGMGFIDNPNIEFGTYIKDSQDISKIYQLIDNEVVWLDDDLYQILSTDIEHTSVKNYEKTKSNWNSSISKRLEKEVTALLVEELFFLKPSEILDSSIVHDKLDHDLSLLAIHSNQLNMETLQDNFLNTKVYKWITQLLNKEKTISFGKITHELHNVLLNDPKPYRKTIKEFVMILFSWFEIVHLFSINQPNYRQELSYSEKKSE